MSWISKKLRNFAGTQSKKVSRKNLYEFISSSASSLSRSNADCLNIGSGGEIEAILRSYDLRLTSIDLDANRQPDIVMDACDLNFKDGTFDAVLMFEVLEHVPTPHLAVTEIHRVLKPGGHLYLSTPFVFGIHDAPHDYFRYTKFGLQFLFKEFDDLKILERNSYLESVVVILLRLGMAADKSSQRVGVCFAVLSVVFAPLLFLGKLLVNSDSATSGYTMVARKRT
ncbi:class I SAM-dependent methyltransferase [Roseibium album]|uniref:Demethylrebeccamycin-D-glucose O-methyltransferase n=1 Tax=Roseibium album TaxID=311410 RepID=A0A0M7A2C3_9HYPH|nr:class I SAM-dependent methyltransferase [Roseibium album]CTQ63120.1 Demethylrebeccamycin-D-glucose O-methyltransferase [Roseibium album]CTQ69238.1 Demethylrebeccamycin-D-glucose O-methyltransferase [Roseibium album]CTQ80598.1 Demethylrebeccamycin-D-glucose O-methyltransferase [Roseibium album]